MMIIFSLVALFIAINLSIRGILLRYLIGNPEAHARASIVPEQIPMDAVNLKNGHWYSLGYAEFLLPSHIALKLQSRGPRPLIYGESEVVSIWFNDIGSPKDPNAFMPNLHSKLTDFPIPDKLRKTLQDHFRDFIDSAISVEKTVPLPFWDALKMNWNEFIVYMIKLGLKVYNPQGRNGVWIYQSKHTKGIVRIGTKIGDPYTDMIYIVLANLDQTISQTFMMSIQAGERQKLKDDLLPFLKSYRFRIDSIKTEDQIRDLIKKAGIQPK